MVIVNTNFNSLFAYRNFSGIQRQLTSSIGKLSCAIDSLQAMEINTVAAKSNITDADMASEVARFSKLQIISQAGLAAVSTDNLQRRVPGVLYSL